MATDLQLQGGNAHVNVAMQNAASLISSLGSKIPSSSDVKERLGEVWQKARPWHEFSNTTQMNIPPASDLKIRITENLKYYTYNYVIIFVVMAFLTILVSPLSILGVIFIFLGYSYLFIFNPEPLSVGSVVLDSRGKGILLGIVSLLILWITGAGSTLTSLVTVVAMLSLAHSAIRKPPGEADFETAYTDV